MDSGLYSWITASALHLDTRYQLAHSVLTMSPHYVGTPQISQII